MTVSLVPGVSHAAFFEALGGLNEADPKWRSHSAGLMVLRLLDTWLGRESEGSRVSIWELRGVRASIEAIEPSNPARIILGGIVDAVERAPQPGVRHIAARLLSYGRLLDHTVEWPLAIDVYQSLLGYLPDGVETDVALNARMRLACGYRAMGRHEDAARTYADAHTLAVAAGDITKELCIAVGQGMLLVSRGNLPAAESVLDAVIARAADSSLIDVRADALHARAVVAHGRGQHEAALRFAYDALKLARNLLTRDRILMDVAVFLRHVGQLDAARDGFLILAATAQERYVRWAAMIDLIEVAALQHNEPLYHQYRRELMGDSLPPTLKAHFHYYSAFAQREFGELSAAMDSLDAAQALADAHGLNQLSFEIDALRDGIRQKAVRESRPTPASEDASVREIVEAVAEMRTLVCA